MKYIKLFGLILFSHYIANVLLMLVTEDSFGGPLYTTYQWLMWPLTGITSDLGHIGGIVISTFMIKEVYDR